MAEGAEVLAGAAHGVPNEALECEVKALYLVAAALDSFVSPVLLEGPTSGDEVRFRGYEHQQLFALRLVDFLEPISKPVVGVSGSCEELLRSVCDLPGFARHASAKEMTAAATALSSWLSETVEFEVHLPSLGWSGRMRLERRDLLYICGNASKHNLGRLTGVSGKVVHLLEKSGKHISREEAFLALQDLYARLHDDILNYYSVWLVQLLNDARWGIHTYLHPIYVERIRQAPGDPIYSFEYPAGVQSRLAKWCFWELMNGVRAGPPLKRFEAPGILKRRYLKVDYVG